MEAPVNPIQQNCPIQLVHRNVSGNSKSQQETGKVAFADETEKVPIVVNYQLLSTIIHNYPHYPQCIWPINLWLGDAHALI